MITRIILRNFQKFKKLDVKLDRVTTLIGPSDSGKSALIRAILWVLTNSPKGTSFIRHGQKKCSVTLYVDGHVIKRIRTPQKNVYAMDGLEYASLSGVPEPIQDVLRVTRDSFQSQHDPSFWLSLSPSEVSKRLNSIADLQIMDDSLRQVLSLKKEATHRVKFTEENRTQAIAEKKKLKFVSAMAEAFSELQKLRRNLSTIRTDTARLRSLLVVWGSAASGVKRLETRLEMACKIARMEREQKNEQAAVVLLRKMIANSDTSELKHLEKLVADLKSYNMDYNEHFCRRAIAKSIPLLKEKEFLCNQRLQTLSASVETPVCPKCGRPIKD